MSDKRPSYMPEVRQFSQADQHVVQKPESLSGPGDEGVKTRDVAGGSVTRYTEAYNAPGNWHERRPATNAATVIGGASILIDDQLGFPASSVMCDNWTNQWLYIDTIRRSIPPYTGGWVLNIPSGSQVARVLLQTPSPQIIQAAALAGEYVFVGFTEALLDPSVGITYSGISTAPVDVNLISLLFGEDPANNVFRVAPKDTTQVTAFPAAATAASASKAAAGGTSRNVCVEVTFSLDAVAAQTILFVTLRDGASGGGTILRQWIIPPLAAAGAYSVTYSNLWIAGSANTAMTVETTNQAGGLTAPAATNFAAVEWTATTEI